MRKEGMEKRHWSRSDGMCILAFVGSFVRGVAGLDSCVSVVSVAVVQGALFLFAITTFSYLRTIAMDS